MLPALFAGGMAHIGGFECRPHLAIALSGGPDSLALTALARDWAVERGGRITALTVDHRLRPAAAEEARSVGRLMTEWGIEHHVLTLAEIPGPGDVMAAARLARYDILEEWCRRAGVLHLLLGHQCDDQAETFLLRLGRGSGLRGLTAMRMVEHRDHVRLLRPLLTVPRAALAGWCHDRGWPVVQDPANADPARARARLRLALPSLAGDGLTVARLAATAGHLARSADLIDTLIAGALVRLVRPHPAGFAWLDLSGWRQEAAELRLRVLSRLLHWAGSRPYPPRFERLERLAERLRREDRGGATLGGGRLLWRAGRLTIGREAADMAAPQMVSPGQSLVWDGRFLVEMPVNGPAGWKIGPLGDARPWRSPPKTAIPRWLWPTLPAWHHLDGVAVIPHLSYHRGVDRSGEAAMPLPLHRPMIRLDDGIAVGVKDNIGANRGLAP